MTKFLKQVCSVQPYKLDGSGNPSHNQFGELLYDDAIECRCRHEVSYREIQEANGSIVKSTSRYFLDESVDIKTDYLIDGCVVLGVSAYVNPLGRIEGYEVYV